MGDRPSTFDRAPKMAVYAAVQRADGRWEYTVSQGSKRRAVGYCHISFRRHPDGHETREEAERCWRYYCIETAIFRQPCVDWEACRVPGCPTPARSGASVDGAVGVVALCRGHMNTEGLAKVLGSEQWESR